MGGGAVWWRGVQLDARSRDMMEAVSGMTHVGPPTQGSWSGASASAGTHSGCGAIDIDVRNMSRGQIDNLVTCMRMVGWAAWYRTAAQGDWIPHIHGIAVQPGGKHDRGCLSSPAHSQVIDYFNNDNGLVGSAPDDGPRDYVGVTWETYSEGDDMPINDADAVKIANAVWSLQLSSSNNQAAHTVLREARDVAKQARDLADSAPARTLNWALDMGGGATTAAWAVLKGTYENTVQLLR